jgi:uncharacterized protein YbjT (DUF2867 family)
VARALIVGCGCHGRELATELVSRGWQARGTSRSATGLAAIEAAGIDAAEADPDRPGTVLELVGDVTHVVWLLGSAAGEDHELEAIHGSRLERLLEKLVDTPVRGFAYEAAGDAAEGHLAQGRTIVERAADTWHIPVAMLEGDRSAQGWASDAADGVERVLRTS